MLTSASHFHSYHVIKKAQILHSWRSLATGSDISVDGRPAPALSVQTGERLNNQDLTNLREERVREERKGAEEEREKALSSRSHLLERVRIQNKCSYFFFFLSMAASTSPSSYEPKPSRRGGSRLSGTPQVKRPGGHPITPSCVHLLC